MSSLTIYEQLLRDKSLTDDGIKKEFEKLVKYKAEDNKRSFAGNKLLYHYMLDALCQVKNKKGQCIKTELTDPERLAYWKTQMEKVNRTGTEAVRYFEVCRVCQMGVNFFKPSVAKYIYKKYNATSVLDPCAGWGGRLLGAYALSINYIGFDTNPDLQEPYERMLEALPSMTKECSVELRWEDSLTADWSGLDFDLVLTSPPYVNLEIYNGMSPWATEADYYTKFLIPLIDKCLRYIKAGGRVCMNISPKMYTALTMKHKYKVADETEEFLQQKRFGVDKGDKTYIWRK